MAPDIIHSHKFVFISGLHRSGTSVLHTALRSNPNVSGFRNTGVPEDEGQHLQTVYKPARYFGGPGIFALHPHSRLNETSELITEENKQKLLQQWGHYWDKTKCIWLEKSPPNLTKTRFLQAIFPDAYFITLIRNPVVVSYATEKWTPVSLETLLRNWLVAYETYAIDRTYLRHELYVSYETLVENPEAVGQQISYLLGESIRLDATYFRKNTNDAYLTRWYQEYNQHTKLVETYQKRVQALGYSLSL